MEERFWEHIVIDCVGGGELTSGHSGDTAVRTQLQEDQEIEELQPYTSSLLHYSVLSMMKSFTAEISRSSD